MPQRALAPGRQSVEHSFTAYAAVWFAGLKKLTWPVVIYLGPLDAFIGKVQVAGDKAR